jgi:hypothetical protein
MLLKINKTRVNLNCEFWPELKKIARGPFALYGPRPRTVLDVAQQQQLARPTSHSYSARPWPSNRKRPMAKPRARRLRAQAATWAWAGKPFTRVGQKPARLILSVRADPTAEHLFRLNKTAGVSLSPRTLIYSSPSLSSPLRGRRRRRPR